ncbi:hypothetical protein [Streptomyces sp. KL116D]|uniref:hypothetical protein n=1 Tax=Streptomyces sp. KL116D TaxID=3045152 RepID=UPI0035568861
MVENFRPGTSAGPALRLQVSWSARYPRLVILHISAFGDTGRAARRARLRHGGCPWRARGALMSTGELRRTAPSRPATRWATSRRPLRPHRRERGPLVERERTGRGGTSRRPCTSRSSPCNINWATRLLRHRRAARPPGLPATPASSRRQAYPAAGGPLRDRWSCDDALFAAW